MKLYMKRLYDFSTLLRATVPEIRYLAPHHEKDESFWQVANIMVDYKFPDADPEITSRLAAAMILRRGRLMQLTRRGPERRAHANTGSETKKGEEPEPAGLAASRAPTSAATVMSAGINTRKLSRVTPSIVSNPVKALDPWELIPSRPKTSETGGFTCRYCHRTLQPMSASRWRRHVLQDIEPLVCLHAACSRPLEMFGDYSAWKSHMQMHDLRWYCRAPCHGGSILVFYHPDDFEQHLCTVHRDTIAKHQIPLLIRNSSRPTSYMPDTCPLCLRAVDDPAMEWKSHILNHLMALALLSADSVINMDQEDGDVTSESIPESAWDSYQMSILDDEDIALLFDYPVNADNGDQDVVMGPWPSVEDEWGFIKGQLSNGSLER
ncbi:hypothetical protein H0G86_007192 [Trichoderma simmonsii]|uniref:Oxidoreductase acuF-like C2H2 type zinc-finger domain-containing protein n=1 Tax=Trichoderma simmonsii TaxID=1491479 RepID=A0A8G0LD04_9HYPO|nr:hypothetical protein H0G86_007192 [Trichoderma simmonsii]